MNVNFSKQWLIVPALVLAASPCALAQETHAVRGMAALCANCHGAGPATQPGAIPPINASDRSALAQQLKDFKSGARPATVMHQLARGFTDAQLEALASYFADNQTTVR